MQSWGQVGSCGSRVDMGKWRKPRFRFMPKGTRELSSCHQSTILSWYPGSFTALGQRPLVSTFSFSEAGLWEVALLSMALGETSALSGLQLPHV